MKVYFCEAPIGFPRSEYGGLVVAIAKNTKELGKILTEAYRELGGSYFNLKLSFTNIKWLELDKSCEYQPGIVTSFVT